MGGNKLRLSILIDSTPAPGKEECKKLSIEDQVHDALELINSGLDSQVDWIMINRLYQVLCEIKKKTPRVTNLLNMIEPVLSKYGYHGVSATK